MLVQRLDIHGPEQLVMPQPTMQLGGANAGRDTLAVRLKSRIVVLALFVGSMWAVFFLSAAMPFLDLNRHGVVPRSLSGLQGILFAPWLHASLAHIAANTGGLLILGWLCMWPRLSNFWEATVGAMLGAGLCAWLFGTSYSVHIGASGLVFGYAGYLIARGYYTRKVLALIVALLVMASFGLSLLIGVLPLDPGLSWQSHIGGLLGGILVVRMGSSGGSRRR
jgi:membrane associated rhomboid family serine protease